MSTVTSRDLLLSAVLLLAAWDARAAAPPPGVRDVSGYEVKDSGYVVPHPGGTPNLYWIDADLVLFVGTAATAFRERTPAAERRPSVPRLNLWNTATNQVSVHHDANLTSSTLCVRDRYVSLRYAIRNNEEATWRSFVFEGLFRKEVLSEIETPKPAPRSRDSSKSKDETVQSTRFSSRSTGGLDKQEFNYITCRQYRRSELPAFGEYVRPLLDGEYMAREYAQDDEQARSGLPGTYWYYPLNGKGIPLKLGDKDAGIGRYFRYHDSYVLGEISVHVIISEKVPRRYGLLDRRGNIRDFTPPSGPWMNSTTSVAPTSRGMFLTSNALFGSDGKYFGGNGAAGAYLIVEGRLVRLVAGMPSAFDVSADGCKVAIAIADQAEDSGSTRRLKMVNLCSKRS